MFWMEFVVGEKGGGWNCGSNGGVVGGFTGRYSITTNGSLKMMLEQKLIDEQAAPFSSSFNRSG